VNTEENVSVAADNNSIWGKYSTVGGSDADNNSVWICEKYSTVGGSDDNKK
jgi:hypothetical protein